MAPTRPPLRAQWQPSRVCRRNTCCWPFTWRQPRCSKNCLDTPRNSWLKQQWFSLQLTSHPLHTIFIFVIQLITSRSSPTPFSKTFLTYLSHVHSVSPTRLKRPQSALWHLLLFFLRWCCCQSHHHSHSVHFVSWVPPFLLFNKSCVLCVCMHDIQAPFYTTIVKIRCRPDPYPIPLHRWVDKLKENVCSPCRCQFSLRMDPVLWRQTLCRRNKSSPPSFLRYCSAVLIFSFLP